MAFIAVLICVIVQHWFNFSADVIPNSWLNHLFEWMKRHAQAPEAGQGFSGVAQYVLIPLIVVALIFWLVTFAFGWTGYFILGVIWLWYTLRIPGRHADEQRDSKQIFEHSYQCIFARLFWFCLLGPVGLALYFFADSLRNFLQSKDVECNETSAVTIVLSVLDWIPVRLLGLTYALVGRFAETFKFWRQQLGAGITNYNELAAAFAEMAVPEPDSHQALALVIRAVWVWVVVLAIISIGMLL